MIRIINWFLITTVLISSTGNKNSTLRTGKDHAVFFAVKDYENWNDLNTPIKDANAIASTLEEKYNFTTEILENPGRLEIRDKIIALGNTKFNQNDQLLIFFTGHGEFVPSSADPEKGRGYFIPADAQKNDTYRDSYIFYPDIKQDIDDIPCAHILVTIDACFSGSFLQYRGGDERPGKRSEREKLIDSCMKKRCRKGITSGGFERTKDGVDHSPFTDRFLSALNTMGGEDLVLTFNELFTKMEGLSPQPGRGYFGSEDSDSKFLFITKTDTYNETKTEQSAKRQADLRDWRNAIQQNTIAAYRDYIRNYPSGQFIYKAQEKIATLEDETDWQIALELDTQQAFQDYLKRHPNGKNRNKATLKIKNRSNSVPDQTEGVKVSSNDTSTTIEQSKSGTSGTFTDSRDGKVYKWVTLKDGEQWMAENLNYEINGSYCYDDNASNCNKYGRLYTWAVAKKACPSGWHLPSDAEWGRLAVIYGGYYDYGSSKNKGNPKSSYKALMDGGSSGFAALLGGNRHADGSYNKLGKYGGYLSSTEKNSDYAMYYDFRKTFSDLSRYGSYKERGRSCRCIQD